MNSNSADKEILVLSDDDRLPRVIELALGRNGLKVEGFRSDSGGQQGNRAKFGNLDLIIVAMSSPTSEPILSLARASLVGQVGQVPLLIISDRPFQSDADDQILHLDFPFDIDELRDKVQEILLRREERVTGL